MGSPQISMGSHSVSMGPYGVSMGLCESLWVSAGPYSPPWGPYGFLGSLWGPYVPPRAPHPTLLPPARAPRSACCPTCSPPAAWGRPTASSWCAAPIYTTSAARGRCNPAGSTRTGGDQRAGLDEGGSGRKWRRVTSSPRAAGALTPRRAAATPRAWSWRCNT